MATKFRRLRAKVRSRLVTIAHEDRGSVSAEAVVIAAVFIAIAVVVGKVFGHAIETEAGNVANKIMGQ